jgi:hypothetical protein
LDSLQVDGAFSPLALQHRDLWTGRERLRTADAITLWLGTGLAEQLLLMWIVALLRKLDVDAGKCRIVQFNKCRT